MRKLILAGLLFLGLPACAHMNGATNVGNSEQKVWVFVNQSGMGGDSGVYRCTDPGNGPPVCIRAVMK